METSATVISLSSVPPRFAGLGPVLDSLLAQGAARVVLVLARAYGRFPGAVAPPPLPGGVELLWSDDHGPASKLIATQRAYPDSKIAICDDDCLYGPGWLAALEGAFAASGGRAAVAGSTFELARLKRHGGRIAQGFAGVLLPPGLCFDPPPEPCLRADDLWFSALLAHAGVDIAPCPAARAQVTPLCAPAPLQDTGRAAAYARAAAAIAAEMGIWPPL